MLRNLTLSVRSGETLVVIGESGCGKSVTLKLMISLLDATSGEVHWEGHHVAGLSRAERDRHRLRFGYLFQNSALFDSFDVFENVAYGLRESGGRSEADIRAVVVERLEEVGLEAEICSKKPAELSGGMRKRVALARALALEPAVMLYDEPTTGLDPLMEAEFQACVREFRDAGGTVLLSSHILAEVESLCDRVSIIRDGRVVESGTLGELRHLTRTSVSAELERPAPDLAGLEGVHDLVVEGEKVRFEVDTARTDAALSVLVRSGVRTLTAQPPTLEDLFLRHYGDRPDA